MTEHLDIAGDSSVLKWLINACQKAAPWLTLENAQIRIDWTLALKKRSFSEPSKSFSPDLESTLQNLLPQWPLSALSDFMTRPWYASIHRSFETEIKGGLLPLSPFERKTLEGLEEPLDRLISHLNNPPSSTNSRTRRGLELAQDIKPYMMDLRKRLPIQHVRCNLRVRYAIGRRLTAMRGEMIFFLKGTSPSHHNSTSDAHLDRIKRREVWHLARRLVRAHAAFFEDLEDIVRHGVPGGAHDGNLSQSLLASHWRRLAKLEKALGSILAGGREHETPRDEGGFTTIQEEYETLLPKNKASTDGRKTLSHSNLFHCDEQVGPFNSLLSLLSDASHRLDAYGTLFYQNNVDIPYQAKNAIDGAIGVLRVSNAAWHKKLTQKSGLQEEIDEAIDWLISESPLLTLLASGFLALSTVSRLPQRYALSLSPWVTVIVMAQKHLGTLPMTYLGMEIGGNEDKSDEQDEGREDANDLHPEHITGTQLWDQMQSV